MHVQGTLLVKEIFRSIQGETSLVGVPMSFVRLSGCNLRCAYCDTAYAFKGGDHMTVQEILDAVRPHGTRHVLLTGGEPLLQRPVPELVTALTEVGYLVSIETHGELPIDSVVESARIVLDIKTPGSGECRGGYVKNLPLLRPGRDEIKFVLTSPADYLWAKNLLQSGALPMGVEVLLSAAQKGPDQPGEIEGILTEFLAEQILVDALPVRFQIQLHKVLWGPVARGR